MLGKLELKKFQPEEETELTTVEKRDTAIKLMGAVASAFLFF